VLFISAWGFRKTQKNKPSLFQIWFDLETILKNQRVKTSHKLSNKFQKKPTIGHSFNHHVENAKWG